MMRTFVEAATGLTGILFTAALVVAVCFWLLVAVGAVTMDSFDADADLDAWSMGGVPVTVALSLLAVLAWLLNVAATALLSAVLSAVLSAHAPSGTATGVLHLLAPAGSLLAAWRLTCLFVRPLRRHFPGEPGPLADHRKHRRRMHR
ncbi:hypothetical protein [Streptomyces sp. NPDC002580]|uniref:hypothetical protein n=1 Tax=Streptomyces sp. NPDC002580 TaxID=3364653 RepID=UPI0036B73757